MKRNTALRHVTELATEADRVARLSSDLSGPLSELWVGDDLLGDADEIEWVTIVLRLDVPDEDLPYLSLHPAMGMWEDLLRLTKRPVAARWRSREAPPWDHDEPRVARVWSAEAGPDELLIEHLRQRDIPESMIESASPQELRTSLLAALPRSERHLADVLDNYWEGDWRRKHKGGGIHPEDHLWRAAEAVRSIRAALTDLG